jgi:RHS repeat-associated protein
MKTMRFALLTLFITTAACSAQTITDPGWFQLTPQFSPVQSQDDAAAQLQGLVGGTQSLALPMDQTYEPATPVAEAITPQIQALADSLQHDPVRIFDWVHDHITFVLYFGSKKGAQLTLLERSGNDFDQCALLVSLLRAAGYTNAAGSDHGVGYQFGWMQVPYDDPYGYDYDLHHWWRLTLNNTDWTTTCTYLGDLCYTRGYPQVYQIPETDSFEFQRVWVALTIDSTTYQLDPAFKISEPVAALPGFSLTNAMGGAGTSISNVLWSTAAGSLTANYVSGMSEVSVRGALTRYTTNLINYLQSNCPNASMEDVLGGWQITPAYNTWDYSPYLPFGVDPWGGVMPVQTWANQPTNLMSTLKVTFAGTNCQWLVPQLQGQRLTLTFDSSGLAQLWQEDTAVAQHATSGTSALTNVILSITHPWGSWNLTNNTFIPNPTNSANQTATNSYQRTNATYALMYAFEPDWGFLQQRQNRLDTYLQQGLTNGSRQVLSESLNVMGLGWLLQTAGIERLLAPQMGILPQYYHRLGRMAQESGKGYYVDVYMQVNGEYPSGGDGTAQMQLKNNFFDLSSLFGSGLEHGIIEQLQNTNLVGASTVKMLQIANTNGQAVYLANSANWSSISGSLINYGSTVLNSIKTQFIDKSYSVLMPANGSNHVAGVGSWAGYGYEARKLVSGTAPDSQMIISGGYHGGYVSDPTAVVDTSSVDLAGQGQPGYYSSVPTGTQATTGADPVDLTDGTFQMETTDLTLGRTEPRGISLTRYYNGTRRNSAAAGMTGGWVHNYIVSAVTVPAPQAGLGGATPAQAAPTLTATAAAIALYNGGVASPKNWTLTALIAKWGVDQLTKNGVSVTLGNDTLQFVQQPDGTFTPPANCTLTLTKANNAYSLHERRGRTFNFDTTNRLASIADPYSGVSLGLTYNASNWVQTVSDWKGRSLTFNYTGTPSRLTSVTDNSSPARSVIYGYNTAYNPQGDLVSVTDPESKTTSFAYDTNHQIIATVDALNQLVVSNIYDNQGHVSTQYTQGDTNKMWRLFWSGGQTTSIDPAGGRRDYYYDDQSRLIRQIDELNHETDTYYDGQNHITQTVSPLGETNCFVYDGNNNVIQNINPLGFTNQFLYDSQNGLIFSIDPLGNTNSFGYNTQFSLTGSTNGAGDWVSYGYNSDGTLYSRTDSAGTTTYGYDSYGQLNSIVYPSGLGSESFVNTSMGDVTSHTDGRGSITSFQYNLRRQLTNTVVASTLTNSASFDAIGNPQSATDPRGFTTTSFWSPTSHLLGRVFPATLQGTPTVTNFYDSRDWLLRTVNNQLSTISYSNDLAGRLISATDPVQRTTTFGFDADGRKTSTTNAAQEATLQQWDAYSRMIRLTDPANHPVQYTFDAAGNQIFLTNRNGKTWQFQYDTANRLTNTITPSLRSTRRVFNDRGLLQSVTQPSVTRAVTFGYDARGRRTSRADPAGTTTYQFDPNNNLTNAFENGRTNSWTFDAYDRVSSYRDSDGNLIQYRGDANGNVTNIVYPGNRNVYYAFDSLNRLTNVTDWANRQTMVGYDLASRVTSITRPNGTVRTMNYDIAGQMTNIVEKLTNGAPIAFSRLNWDNAARVQWEFAAPLPHTNTTPPSRSMTFNDDNQISTFNGLGVSYDSDGNMTSAPLTNSTFFTYGYNARNQLTNAGGITYSYDPTGNRIAMTNGANITRYVVNPNTKLPQVLMRMNSGVTNYYIYGAGLLYEITETATTTNTLTYHFDYRGSTIALTDKTGNVTDRIEYSAYGLTTCRGGTNDTPFLYNGRYGVMTDPNGLLYMRARYYNPYICRFINPDPAGFAGGLNWYSYADGNPVSIVDPFGLQGIPSPANIAVGFGPGFGESVADWNNRFQAANQQALPIEASALGGYAVGAAGATAAAVGATTLVSAGVPQSVVTGGLFVTGVAGFTASGYSIYNNPSPNNVAFNAGGLAGGLAVGGFLANDVASALSPSGYQPSSSASLASELSMVWRDNNGNPNPLSMLPAWLLPGAEVGPMSTGPSTGGAAGAIGGAGSGVAGGFSLWAGQSSVNWFGNPVSSSSTGKH